MGAVPNWSGPLPASGSFLDKLALAANGPPEFEENFTITFSEKVELRGLIATLSS